MDIPSLFMIPSAVSSGKVHSVFPNSTDADFDFNRDSDATRVNSEGLIERVGYYGSELVTNGDFSIDAHWTQGSNISISNGKLIFDNANRNTDFAQQSITAPTGVTYRIIFTVSDLKSGDSVKVRYPFQDTSVDSNGTHTLFAVGTTANFIRFTPNSLTGTFKIDNVSVKEVTGDRARLNYEIEGGLINTKPSLLLEPQSTNLLAYSEDFSDYTTSNVTVTHNQGTSPDGLNNAAKMLMSSGTGTHRIYENISSSLNDNNTFSVFIKEQSEVSHIGLNADTASAVAWFSGANGSVINANGLDAKTQSFGNGWHRISVSYVADSNDSSDNQFVYFSNRENTSPNVAFNGTESVLMYGFQAEKQSYPTSYIPTNGSTQTRAAETCNGAGTSSILPSEEGILYAEIAALESSSTLRSISVSDGTPSNRFNISFWKNGSDDKILNFVGVGGVSQCNFFADANVFNFNKIAFRIKANKFEMYINGVLVGTDTSGNTYSAGTLNTVRFDRGDGNNKFYGKIRDIRVYNTKEMTDSEVDILLTKITS